MEIAVRSPLKAGVIAVSASAIALSPFAPTPTAMHLPSPSAVSTAAVRLAAAYNPLQPWIDAFQLAGADMQALGQTFSQAPAVLLQQILANQVTHIGEVLKNPGSIGTVLGQVVKNVQSVVQAATLLNTDYNGSQIYGSADGWHNIIVQEIPKLLPTANNPQATEVISQVLNVLASPLSGVLIGLAGPVLSPGVALINTAQQIVTALMAGHAAAALQGLVNTPANVVGAFFNGATVNLDGLVPLINKAGILSDDTTLYGLNLALGGLLSSGAVGEGGTSGTVFGVGGSIVNALGQNFISSMMGFPLSLDIPGQPVGPIGSIIGFGQAIAKAIGWSGTGNPLAAVFPTAKKAATPAAATALVSKTSTTNSPTAIPSAAVSGVKVSDVSASVKNAVSDTSGSATKTDSGKSGAAKKSHAGPGASTKSGANHHGKSHASSGSHHK